MTQQALFPISLGGATISACGAFRYRLWRGPRPAQTLFVMLNPSTATADVRSDDPTIRKCRGFTEQWGLDGFEVVNLFAFRATSPKVLARRWRARPPPETSGPDNDGHIRAAIGGAGRVVVAWGNLPSGTMRARRDDVLRIIAALGAEPVCLGRTRDGEPRHPLMLPYATPLEPF